MNENSYFIPKVKDFQSLKICDKGSRLMIDATEVPKTSEIMLVLGLGEYQVQHGITRGTSTGLGITGGMGIGPATAEVTATGGTNRSTTDGISYKMMGEQIHVKLSGGQKHTVCVSNGVNQYNQILKEWPLQAITVLYPTMSGMKYHTNSNLQSGGKYLMAQPTGKPFQKYHELKFLRNADIVINLIEKENQKGTAQFGSKATFSKLDSNNSFGSERWIRKYSQKLEQYISIGKKVLENGDCSSIEVVICGNPGVGKSTLASSISNSQFKSGISRGGAGLTRQLQRATYINDERMVLTDTPGLSCLKTRKLAAEAVTSAFNKCIEKKQAVKLIFVVRLEAGRIESTDVMTINEVINSIKLPGNLTNIQK